MIDPRNSRRIRPYLRSNSKAVKDALRPVFCRFMRFQANNVIRKTKPSDWPVYFRHLQILILNLYSAWNEDPKKAVGYSRGKPNFVRGGSYWDYVIDKSLFSEKVFLGLIDFLAAEGMIENQIAAKGNNPFSSRMRALPPLINLWKQSKVTWAHIDSDSNSSAIVVKDTKNKRPITPPEDPGFDLEQAEANLRRINDNFRDTFINLNVTDKVLEDIRIQMSHGDELDDDPSHYGGAREPFEPSNRRLRRIFANGTYNDGGRFYGGWWQGLPSRYRKYIEIDGAVSVELDYSTIQPRCLYASVEAEPPVDSYRVAGWSEELRPTIKKAFNQLVNSSRKTQEPSQWHKLAPELDLDPIPENWANLNKHQKRKLRRAAFEQQTGQCYDSLLSDLLEMHNPINGFFFSRSWTWLHRMDSDIAEKVMLRLLDISLTVLPIHDSFIVRRGGEGELDRIMKEAFAEVVGSDIRIDRSDALFPSPFEQGAPLPPEQRMVCGKELVVETRNHMIEASQYYRREAEWMQERGPL
jgi:hypothetical protein